MKKQKILLVSLLISSLLVPAFASAATFMTGSDGNVLVKSSTDIRDNVYAAGKSVSVQQVVFGDLLAAGATVLISENVSDDVWAAGASVSLLGSAGGDARMAGSNVLINAPVAKDLLVAGGTVTVSNKTTVGNDMVLAGGVVTFDGTAQKSARVYGGEIVLNGTINGDVLINASKKLTFGPGAKINGNLTYRANKEITIPAGVVGGKVTFEASPYKNERGNAAGWLAAIFAGFAGVMFLMMLIGALVLINFLPNFTREAATTALTKSGSSMLRGLIAAIVMPIAGVILLITILGWFVGWSVLAVFALILILAKAMTSIILGSWIVKTIRRDGQMHITWKAAAVGAIALSLLVMIPIIGWIICFIVWLISFGATSTYIYEKLWLSAK